MTPIAVRFWCANSAHWSSISDAVDLGSGDEEKLLVPVGGEFLEALVQEQGADGVARGRCASAGPAGGFSFAISVEGVQEFIGLADLQE